MRGYLQAIVAVTAIGLMAVPSALALEEVPVGGVPVAASPEPDRDGDGFGDETQDECPYNATIQTECPPVHVKLNSVKVRKRTIVVELGVSSQARIQVFGQVSWQVSEGHGRKHGLAVGMTAGAPRTVLPGTAAGFAVRLPKSVLRRLGRLTPSETLRPRITVRVTDLAGRENDRVLTLKLHGRDR